MKRRRAYTVAEGTGSAEGATVLMFDEANKVNQSRNNAIDAANDQIMLDLKCSLDQIDWRDDYECWVWKK